MKGILFKPDMIKAIVEGRKTQTRRVIKIGQTVYKADGSLASRHQAGEVVYIKEAWRISNWDCDRGELDVEYRSGGQTYSLCSTEEIVDKYWIPNAMPEEWRSPLFMPEWAARYFIKITDVRPERLQEITEADAIAEGIEKVEWGWRNYYKPSSNGEGKIWASPLTSYKSLWDSINKPPYDWGSNPWIFAHSFTREVK